jgi:transcriptional antiterminator RfaH
MNDPAQAQKASTLNSQLSIVPAWFCLRTHSKHEHIAGGWLRRRFGIETYAPRIRFRRLQPRGPVWFTEALFPNYVFARFELARWLHELEAAPGVCEVVHFGAHYPCIPHEVIQGLRLSFGAQKVRVLNHELHPGETVQLASSPFHGLEAIVARVMPQRQRVTVLLDFLGRQTRVEVACSAVVPVGDERGSLFR